MRPFARRMLAGFGFTMCNFGVAAPAALADPPAQADILDETRRLQAIAAQQVEADVRQALADAGRLAETDGQKAIERYRAALSTLRANTALPEERQATLVRILEDRIRIAEQTTAAADISAAERKAREAIDKLQKLDAEKLAAEREQVKTGLSKASDLRKEGKLIEAAQLAKELLKQHPDNLTVQILNGISTPAASLHDAKAVQADKDEHRTLAMRDLDRSAVAPNSDIEYPKDWKDKSAKRLKAQQLSPAEMRIMQALSQPIQTEFKGSRLQDVIDTISTMSATTIVIDKPSLDENQLSYDTPVTFSTKNTVATRTALRAMLNQLSLTYVVRDGVLQVTSLSRARDMMVTKSYYIGDLVAVSGFFGGSTQYGLALDQAQLGQNVAGIVEMITSSLDPMSWQGKGGSGTIGFNIPTMSLIVRQSAEVHRLIGREFGK